MLTELEPSFVGEYTVGGLHLLPNINGAQGVLFRCPKPGCSHRIVVWFSNPSGTPPVPPEAQPLARWQVSGESLATLTLSPSINIPGDWHGFIQNGQMIDA
jgi:hypothetical protein